MPRTDGEGNEDAMENSNRTFVVDEEALRDPAGNPIFPCFDIGKLTPIPPFSVSHFDETHRKDATVCHKNTVKQF
eukprot:15365904-Ditylum_brightwellii.AAC.1